MPEKSVPIGAKVISLIESDDEGDTIMTPDPVPQNMKQVTGDMAHEFCGYKVKEQKNSLWRHISRLISEHGIVNKKDTSKEAWVKFRDEVIAHAMFNKAVKRKIKKEDKLCLMMIEYILQDRVKRESKKEKIDEAVITNFKDLRTRKRTVPVSAPTHSVREEAKRARLLENPETPLNVSIYFIDPLKANTSGPDEEECDYDTIVDRKLGCSRELITCDNYTIEELMERIMEAIPKGQDRYVRELRGIIADPKGKSVKTPYVHLREHNIKAWWTRYQDAEDPSILAILGRETITEFENRVNADQPAPRPDTPLSTENVELLPPVIEDDAVIQVVDDNNLSSDFVGTTGVPKSIVGFESAIAMHHYKINQHQRCIKSLVKERVKQRIDPDALLDTNPAWNEYLKICTLTGLMDRKYKEISIKMARKKARAIVAALDPKNKTANTSTSTSSSTTTNNPEPKPSSSGGGSSSAATDSSSSV